MTGSKNLSFVTIVPNHFFPQEEARLHPQKEATLAQSKDVRVCWRFPTMLEEFFLGY